MTDAVLRPTVFADVPGLVAGFTTRSFAGPNETLAAGRVRLAKATGLSIASVGQVHGAGVAVVREAGHVPSHDGLVTDEPGLLLSVIAADCVLVLLADPAAGVVGACHSGWRGTVAGILGETVGAMQALGAEPDRLLAYVGPCISASAFEVGEEVAAQFDAEVVTRRPEWPRPHVDLKAEVIRQLDAAGVSDEHIERSDACTFSDTGRFYSYRAEGGTRGRMFGFIGRRA